MRIGRNHTIVIQNPQATTASDSNHSNEQSKQALENTTMSWYLSFMTHQPQSTPANWYPDSQNPTLMRWWDGTQWTQQTQPKPMTGFPPPITPPVPRSNGLAIAALVLGIIAAALAFIPILNFGSIILGLLAGILGIVAVANKHNKAMAITGLALGVLAILITIVILSALNQASNESGIDNLLEQSTSAEKTAPASPTPSIGASSQAPTVDTSPVSAFGNGDYLVGDSFPAGTYRAEVEPGYIEICSVTHKTASGDLVDWRSAGDGSVIFTVADIPGSIISFSGCQNIGIAADMIRSDPSTVTNGFWLVGDEIGAGMYQCTVDTTSVIAYGSVSQHGLDGSLIDWETGNAGNVLFNVQDTPGSVVEFSGCSEVVKI